MIFKITFDPHGFSQKTWRILKQSRSSMWFFITMLNTRSVILKREGFVWGWVYSWDSWMSLSIKVCHFRSISDFNSAYFFKINCSLEFSYLTTFWGCSSDSLAELTLKSFAWDLFDCCFLGLAETYFRGLPLTFEVFAFCYLDSFLAGFSRLYGLTVFFFSFLVEGFKLFWLWLDFTEGDLTLSDGDISASLGT